ncbi:oxaloacetate decarboxylase [Variovorax sp. KK3]|uniref:isocitrate lyase/PEP mutase family protein n=1 Tax=Variovorax sp. KK3 TaxID=1855728 RepID=UPI00097BB9CA|nr:isocitrate lyase/PEP mutase family protein [Variovorax sp. KK3]
MPLSKSLKNALAAPGLLVAPGVYDCIGATLAAEAGFGAIYMTGAGVSMSLGYPDFGLLTLTEMRDRAATIARSARLPLIADADTGYGNELNVIRTVREYQDAGAAAIHIEDQVSPKRCGHLDGKEIVPRQEFVSKIRAAVSARTTDDFMIIARTDAIAVDGFDEAVWRANAALDAGADIAFVEAPRSLDEAAAVPARVHGACLINLVPNGRTPITTTGQAEQMGYKLAILPALTLMATLEAVDDALAQLRLSRELPQGRQSVEAVFRRFGAGEWEAQRRRFGAGLPM